MSSSFLAFPFLLTASSSAHPQYPDPAHEKHVGWLACDLGTHSRHPYLPHSQTAFAKPALFRLSFPLHTSLTTQAQDITRLPLLRRPQHRQIRSLHLALLPLPCSPDVEISSRTFGVYQNDPNPNVRRSVFNLTPSTVAHRRPLYMRL